MHPQEHKRKRLNTKQAADYIGMSESWLNKDRGTGAQVPHLKIGTRVLYDVDDLDAFLAKSRRLNTAAAVQHAA